MATQAQILANRSNARKSTGPRTPEGKAVVAQNAVKHGLCGRETVIQGEDLGEFEFHRERMLAELDPVGELESSLAERIVGLSWRLQRAERLQATAFDSLFARQKHSPMEQYDKVQDADGGSVLGRALVRDFADCRVLDRLLMYERRIEHSLYRTMAELKRHRILQEVGPGKMWELRRALASDDAETGNHGRDARATKTPAGGPAKTPEGGSSGNDAGIGDIGGGCTEADCGEPAGSVSVRAYPRPKEDKITPDGVTTNEDERAPEGLRLHEGGLTTNEDGRATPCAAETLDALPFALHDPPCRTKQISPSADHLQAHFNKEFTADPLSEQPRKTKPIRTAAVVSSGTPLLRTSNITPAVSQSTSPCIRLPNEYNCSVSNQVGIGVSSLR